MTVHMFSCRELASDLPTITKLEKHFWTLERTITPTSLLLPWLPTPSKYRKLMSIRAMYATLRNHVEARKKAAVPSSDAIDILWADGVSNIEGGHQQTLEILVDTVDTVDTIDIIVIQ